MVMEKILSIKINLEYLIIYQYLIVNQLIKLGIRPNTHVLYIYFIKF